MLSDDDLAYMRETQTQSRPTEATLVRRIETPDGMGGTDTTDGDPQPIAVRVARTERIPESVANRYGPSVVTITMDLAVVTAGDRITVSPLEAYEVVSDGAVGVWTTAQQVYAVRTVWPTEGA